MGFGDGPFGLPVSEVVRVRLARAVRGHRCLDLLVSLDRGLLQQLACQLSAVVAVERVVEDGGNDGRQSQRRYAVDLTVPGIMPPFYLRLHRVTSRSDEL